ncbi:AAA family ATPase [Paenibacillus pasadenensis]|uniref:Cell division protein FtsH n=1 Tax=Paenibacillus pasadenensis TaxID=217090 RepID=A0A2N5N8R5_9BACL|nr:MULTISPECIES: ATP-binding protein [Paenibacillus]PLT46746.1 Cell division protein FtsH [Paenibacillus pasadenensis]
MSKSSAYRLPRSKGTDTATVYSPKECARRTRRIVYQEDNRRIVEEFLRILSLKDKFAEHDVPIPNKLLLYGPPGTGKTLTAFAIAARLEVPLLLVRLDSIIHSHLGETASNIRRLFDYARSQPCVLFLDEFDAVARTRENNDEVKEMTRVVNTLLQCLDEFEEGSVFMAATNLDGDLDAAIWRRFDTKLSYAHPDEPARLRFVGLLIGDFPAEPALTAKASDWLRGCSFADIEQIMLKAKRKAILADGPLTAALVREAGEEYQPRRTPDLEEAPGASALAL